MESYDSLVCMNCWTGVHCFNIMCQIHFCRTFSHRKVESCLQSYLVDFDILIFTIVDVAY